MRPSPSIGRRFAHYCAVLMSCSLLFGFAHSQTYSVLYTFTGNGLNGRPFYPNSGLVMNSGGILFGTTLRGGSAENGSAFQLKRAGSGWVLNLLYSFQGGTDGIDPEAGLTISPSGVLYGTTGAGGDTSCGISNGCGTVYILRPPATAPRTTEIPWNETVLYRFHGSTDGSEPGNGRVVLDSAGNLYGTTQYGGDIVDCSSLGGCGTVYQLSPSGIETVLYAFDVFNGKDGYGPSGGVIFDSGGNLYGTNQPTVYQLVPAGGSWTENILYNFQTESFATGSGNYTSLLNSGGNLYGVTQSYGASGPGGGGTVYELGTSGGFNLLYDFGTTRLSTTGPEGPLVMDAAGNLYGVSFFGGVNGVGSVYKLSPSGGGWTYTDLYDFTGLSDGGGPVGNLVIDSAGNLYGTTCCNGGSNGGDGGVIFEIGLNQ